MAVGEVSVRSSLLREGWKRPHSADATSAWQPLEPAQVSVALRMTALAFGTHLLIIILACVSNGRTGMTGGSVTTNLTHMALPSLK